MDGSEGSDDVDCYENDYNKNTDPDYAFSNSDDCDSLETDSVSEYDDDEYDIEHPHVINLEISDVFQEKSPEDESLDASVPVPLPSVPSTVQEVEREILNSNETRSIIIFLFLHST